MNPTQKVLLIGGNISDFGAGMFGPFLAVFTQKIGGDLLQISWASALYLFMVGTLTIVMGRLSDSYDKARIMMLGYGLSTTLTFGYLLVSKPLHLFMIEAGLGIATALSLPTWNALYSENAAEDKHGSSWGLASGLSRIVSAISIVLGGILLSNLSFNALFITMGTIQAIATIYQAKILFMKKETAIVSHQ